MSQSESKEVASARHFDSEYTEGVACVEIDYATEIPDVVDTLHDAADQLEHQVRNYDVEDPEALDSKIVNLRIMADKLAEADPN